MLASENARFCLSEVTLGLVPAGDQPYVVRAMGMRQARRYAAERGAFRCHHRLPTQRGPGSASLISCRQRTPWPCGLNNLPQRPPGDEGDLRKRLLAALKAPRPPARKATVETIARVRVGPEAQEGIQAFFGQTPPNLAPLAGDEV